MNKEHPKDYRAIITEFAKNLDLILDHAAVVLVIPRYFFCQLPHASISAPFVPGGDLPLGILMTLWMNAQWMDICPTCTNALYIIGASGSTFTGTNQWRGVCRTCAINNTPIQYGSSRYFLGNLYIPAVTLLKLHNNDPVYPKPHPWSWSRAPAVDPPAVPKRPIEPVDLAELIDELNGWMGLYSSIE